MMATQVGAPPAGAGSDNSSDSGSDIFEYMAVCRQQQKHFLIHAFRNRRLVWSNDNPEAAEPARASRAGLCPGPGARAGQRDTVTLPAAEHGEPARQAHLALQWAAITLAPPVQAPPEIRAHGPLKVWVVRAWEPDPPPDVEPVECILLLSLPVETLGVAQTRVDWYTWSSVL